MNSLAGQLLVAMPQMSDPRFVRSVIYLCAHGGETGAMGLVINKLLGSLTMGELFAQLEIEPSGPAGGHPVHFGGPVDAGRGFVLHTADYCEEATLHVDGDIAVTATPLRTSIPPNPPAGWRREDGPAICPRCTDIAGHSPLAESRL